MIEIELVKVLFIFGREHNASPALQSPFDSMSLFWEERSQFPLESQASHLVRNVVEKWRR